MQLLRFKPKDYRPERFGLQYNPPMISNKLNSLCQRLVLEYMIISKGKLYHHKMNLRKLEKDSKTRKFVKYLKKRHPKYLSSGKISDLQLTSSFLLIFIDKFRAHRLAKE